MGGRVELANLVRRQAALGSGDKVFFRYLGKGVVEVRSFPKMTWHDIVALYGNNDPLHDLEEVLTDEEHRLAEEFR